jgi:hypothetical protein
MVRPKRDGVCRTCNLIVAVQSHDYVLLQQPVASAARHICPSPKPISLSCWNCANEQVSLIIRGSGQLILESATTACLVGM